MSNYQKESIVDPVLLKRGARILNSPPTVKGKWIEFVTSDYATRERRTRILIDPDDISGIKENYDFGYRDWCRIFMKNGNDYQVLSSYDDMVELLASLKEAK